MTPDRIYLSPPHLGGDEATYVNEALASNWVAPVGPFLQRFEARIGAYVGAPHVVALQSGTAALHLALRLLGVRRGDVVLCPSFNFAGGVFPILYEGATPHFVDSEPLTWNMCPEALARALKRPAGQNGRPKVLLITHLYGQPARLDELLRIARQHDLFVVEDAAEAFGATYRGRALGTWGDLGVYSF
ncbi:MAG: DegT/DnrJ/EryC1/StrS aminotransferase family protein, partial [Catalinimonas sp.]